VRGGETWTFPTNILGNLTLYDFNKGLLGGLAQAHARLTPGEKADLETFAGTFPYTSIKGVTGYHDGFAFFMHYTKPIQLIQNYNGIAFGQRVKPYFSVATSIAHDESEAPAPVINTATYHHDGSWEIGVSNWPAGLGYNDYYAIYVTAPGHITLPPSHLYQISSLVYNGFDPPPWNSSDIYAVPGPLVMPFPIGARILMGMRTFTTDPSIMPSPIAFVGVAVSP
jgi:hypothetical protein